MSRHSREPLLGAMFCAVFLAAGTMAFGASAAARSVERVRYSVRGDITRVVLDLSAAGSYETVSYHDPERIAVNLLHFRASKDLVPVPVERGIVERVRFNRLSWGTQVVLDLREEATWNHFFLARVADLPDRVVLDVSAPREPKTYRFASPRASGPGPGGARRGRERPMIVAVDAGHGGSDPGAVGWNKLVEKEIVLDIARRIAGKINARDGFKAVLTRERDVYLTLESRTQIAQRKGADVFVSIHLNAARRRNARGAEVFFLSPAGAEAKASKLMRNKGSAAKELGVDGLRSDDLLYMLLDVNQQAMMQRSSLLAEEILKALSQRGLPPTRAVKQRSFAVLKAITMPSVIVEAGFLSNSQDAKVLRSAAGKERIAAAITDGVIDYLRKNPPPMQDGDSIIVHKVRRGETLWQISRAYNTTVATIRRANRLGNSSTIHVGQELVIRGRHEAQ